MFNEDKNCTGYQYMILCREDHCYDKTQKMFGIAVIGTYGNRKFILEYVQDLALNLNKLYNLVHLCNRMSLDPIHLHDVINDFIADF